MALTIPHVVESALVQCFPNGLNEAMAPLYRLELEAVLTGVAFNDLATRVASRGDYYRLQKTRTFTLASNVANIGKSEQIILPSIPDKGRVLFGNGTDGFSFPLSFNPRFEESYLQSRGAQTIWHYTIDVPEGGSDTFGGSIRIWLPDGAGTIATATQLNVTANYVPTSISDIPDIYEQDLVDILLTYFRQRAGRSAQGEPRPMMPTQTT